MIGYILGGLFVGAGARFMQARYGGSRNQKLADVLLSKATLERSKLVENSNIWLQEAESRLDEFVAEETEHLATLQKRADLLEQKLDKRAKKVAAQREATDNIQLRIKQLQSAHDDFVETVLKSLETKSNCKIDEVLQQLKANYDVRFKLDYEHFLAKSEQYTKDTAQRRVIHILTSVMNRYSEPSSVDRLPNHVTVPYDKVKGRIIGKDGRNIAYFEQQTQVNVVFNDSDPNVITVSCFHLLRREIAIRALRRLCKEKNISERVIDHAIERAKYDLDRELLKIGTNAANIIELPQEYRDEKLLRLIGRLKYRTSYGQNILYHSLEMAYFCSMLAAEIGADVEVARFAGFFHDLGKAIDQDDDIDKPHDLLSKELLESFNFPWEIVHAAWVHHDAEPAETVEAVLVKVGDALSASRPGARAESTEDYFARMQALEEYALATEGAEKVLTMSAGREVRVFMNTKDVTDDEMLPLAEKLAQKIEDNLSYPGKIKVNMVRQFVTSRTANKGKSK